MTGRPVPEGFMFEAFRMFGWTEADFKATRPRTIYAVLSMLRGLDARRQLDEGVTRDG